ncbi:hypothetical protein H6763_01780 [Candidatus Nomurabacteria bacterium]|nr:hypothetical protein [Candidatus Nomurabacteria bacterium]MCB9803537.1 hypothetical protein [Candidatus Nomurabacteria bacterium]
MKTEKIKLYISRVLFTLTLLLFSLTLVYQILGREKSYQIISEITGITLDSRSDTGGVSGGSLLNPVDLDEYDFDEESVTSTIELNTEGRIGLGVYLPELQYDTFDLVVAHEENIGHKMEYLLFFQAWDEQYRDFPTYIVKQVDDLQATAIITWEPWERDFINPTRIQPDYSLQSIIDGEHDEYIAQWATEAKASDMDIILRFAHEQSTPEGELNWYPWQGDPIRYVQAYRRIWRIFDELEVDNVRFMWNPMWIQSEWSPRYYPGDNYVDIIGLSVLNHGTKLGETWEKWFTCDELLTEQYKAASKYNKPVIVAEYGSSEIGGNKARWYEECHQAMIDSPNIIGAISIQIPSDVTYQNIDWRYNSTSASSQAYIDSIDDRVFK